MGYHTAAGTQTMYKVEKVYGTASGTSQWFGLVQDHTPDENENRQPIRYVGGGGRNVHAFLDGPTDFRNTIPYIMQTGQFIGAAFGKVASSSGTTSTHTITESGTLPSFTIEEALDAITNEHLIRTHAGCVVDVLEISSEDGGPVMVNVDCVAQSSTQSSGTKTAVTAATSKPYMWSMCRVNISGASLDGMINELKSFNWRLSNGLDPDHYMNSASGSERNIDKPEGLERDYEFNMELNATYGTGGDIYDMYFRAGSETNIDLYIFRTSGTDSVQIWMSGCKTLDCDLPEPQVGKVVQSWMTQPTSCGASVKDATAAYPFSTV